MAEAKNSTSSGKIAKKDGQKPTVNLLDFFIIGSIVLVFFLSPLFFTGQVLAGMGFEKMILFYFLVLLSVVAWVTKGVLEGELKLKRTPLDWPILATLVIFAVTTVLSVSRKDSLIGSHGDLTKSFVAVIVFSLFYYLVVNNINLKRIKIIFWAILASASLVIAYSLAQLLGFFILPFPFTHSASFNPIGSLTGLTAFVVACLPLLVVTAAQIKEIHPKLNKFASVLLKVLVILVIAAGLGILALLNGFTFWPGAIAGVVIVLMFFLAKIIFVSNNNLIIPLVVFLSLIILLVLGNFNVMNLNLPTEVSLSRGASWQIAKNSLKTSPFFGSGPATFYYDFSKFRGTEFNASPLWNARFDNSSGILFELLATVGSVGTLFAIIVGLIVLSICFLALIKNVEKEVHSLLLGMFSSFLVTMMLALLFSFNSFMILWLILISVMTVSTAIKVYPEKFQSIKLSFRSSPKYALALAAVFLCMSAGVVILFTMGMKMYLADVYAKKASALNINEQVVELKKAATLFPYEDSYYISLANNYMALANGEAGGAKDQAKIESNLSLAIEAGKKSVDISPNKAANNEALALIYENASFYTRGALEWSENLYNKVKELEPDNPTPFLRVALINMARSNAEQDQEEKKYYIEEALKKYDEAIAKKSDLTAAFYGKAIAYEKLNNNNEAIEQLKKAVISTTNNIDYRFELGRLYFNRGITPQSSISQNDSDELSDGTEGEDENDDLSVDSTSSGGTISRNDDINMAEQMFYSIYQTNPKHANALYSLALLYQKIGERDKAEQAVKVLLEVVAGDAPAVELVKKQFVGLY